MNVKIELDKHAKDAVSDIEKITGLSMTEVFNTSLSLFHWAVRQKREGRAIASLDASQHTFREIEIPALNRTMCYAANDAGEAA